MKIREITQGDVQTVLELAKDMHKESWFAAYDFDEAKAASIWERKQLFPNDWCLLLAEDNDQIIGVFVGFIVEHFFGRDRLSSDLILYVDPAHRGGTAAMRLVKAYEEWARNAGVKEIQLGIATNVHVDRTARLFEKLGFGDRAVMYRKRV